eukprot:scaffold6090_cov326-Prasinococcus_capsulatus_cf.AAC.1
MLTLSEGRVPTASPPSSSWAQRTVPLPTARHTSLSWCTRFAQGSFSEWMQLSSPIEGPVRAASSTAAPGHGVRLGGPSGACSG